MLGILLYLISSFSFRFAFGFFTEGSVNINPQKGITITSIKLNSSSSSLPIWVEKQFMQIGESRNAIDVFPQHNHGQLCNIEILGYTNLVKDPFFLTSNFMNRNYSAMMLYVGVAELINIAEKSTKVKCYYKVTEEGWRKTGISIYPSEFTHKILFYYCPIYSSTVCKQIEELENATVPSKIYIKTVYPSKDGSLIQHKNYFWINPLLNNVPNYKNDLMVCTIRPYVSGHPDKQLVYDTVLKLWVKHYVNIGARIVLYDASGNNTDLALIGSDRVQYINSTIQRFLQRRTDIYRIDRHEVTGQYYVNGVEYLNGSYLGIANHYRKINNDDKVFTMTHCRFEARARYGIETVLVVDPDEFMFCNTEEMGYSAQRAAIQGVIRNAQAEGGTQMYMQMIVPSFRELNKLSVTDCMKKAIREGRSIFSCFSDYYVKNSELKSLHFQLTCPVTGYHQSCEDSLVVKNNLGCTCNMLSPTFECNLIHVSHYTKIHRDKDVAGKFPSIYGARCPLEVLLQ